jgi:hypothetical protein
VNEAPDAIGLLRGLAESAGRAPVPFVDVRRAVARRIAHQAVGARDDTPWPTAVGLALAAAAAVFLAAQTLLGLAEPFAVLLLAVEGVLS